MSVPFYSIFNLGLYKLWHFGSSNSISLVGQATCGIFMLVYVHMWVCVHVCICVISCAGICVCLCTEARSWCQSHSLPFTWCVLVQLSWLANKFQGFSYLFSSHVPCTSAPLEVTDTYHHIHLLHGCWKSELKFSCLYGKHFSHWANSPVPNVAKFIITCYLITYFQL